MPRQATDDTQWHAAVADFRRSGLTQHEFCRRRGLPLHTFRRRLYARTDPPLAPASAEPTKPASARADARGFIPVTLVPGPSAAATDPLVLILDGRHRIAVGTGFDLGTLRRLVDALGGPAVIGLPPNLRVFVAVAPADLRKSYDTLAQLARDALGQDPLSGHLLVFANRRRDRIKILYWGRDGYATWMKRLERGTFGWPAPGAAAMEWTAAELAAMLGGIDLMATRRRPRFTLEAG